MVKFNVEDSNKANDALKKFVSETISKLCNNNGTAYDVKKVLELSPLNMLSQFCDKVKVALTKATGKDLYSVEVFLKNDSNKRHPIILENDEDLDVVAGMISNNRVAIEVDNFTGELITQLHIIKFALDKIQEIHFVHGPMSGGKSLSDTMFNHVLKSDHPMHITIGDEYESIDSYLNKENK